MKFERLCCFIAVATLLSCNNMKVERQSPANLSAYVDPYIGTGGHGHVFLGANVPFGFVQLGPTQHTRGWDWCSGYHYSDSVLAGFSHLHLSGTGIGDLGDVALLPVVGNEREQMFRHENEVVKPGYYAVKLDGTGIGVELTATARTGFHKYTYPPMANGKAGMLIDLKYGIGWDEPVEGFVTQENDSVISGYRISTGWAKYQQVYFSMTFSQPIARFEVSEADNFSGAPSLTAKNVFGKAQFDLPAGTPLYVKVGLSAVSIDNAKLNLETEQPGWNFERTAKNATDAWNRELNRIRIKTGNEDVKKVFYTALYHSMFAPSLFCDVNGDYRGSDRAVHQRPAFKNYTTFSLWDTYRAAHPLATLIHKEQSADYGRTMIAIFNEQGKLPVWHLMGNETDCMVGNPAIPVLADLVLKGFDVDKEAAYQAMKASAMLDERGLGYLREYGYIPYDKEPEALSKSMEYALADWSLAQVAKQLGKQDDYDYFVKRSKAYTHYFDPKTGFMRGLSSDGKFRTPFNPFESVHRDNDYTEGNAWQYTWLVPHDVHGLIGLFGSDEAFISKLDSLFTAEGDLGANASPDISGLIGQYAHGNEPSHHILYLYAYVGQPWKTAEKVRQVLTTLYTSHPDGLSGNEDVGQMSAWYILSALGFYQVAPAGGVYVFGSPLIDEATLDVGDGKTFNIIAHHNSDRNIYIQKVMLDGEPYTKSYINYADIVAGGTLEFFMGDRPSDTFGVAKEDRP